MDKNQEWGRSKGAQNGFNKTGQSAYIYMTSCNKCWTGIQLHKTASKTIDSGIRRICSSFCSVKCVASFRATYDTTLNPKLLILKWCEEEEDYDNKHGDDNE